MHKLDTTGIMMPVLPTLSYICVGTQMNLLYDDFVSEVSNCENTPMWVIHSFSTSYWRMHTIPTYGTFRVHHAATWYKTLTYTHTAK